jgi:ATP-dependent helicase/nuclease subunit B
MHRPTDTLEHVFLEGPDRHATPEGARREAPWARVVAIVEDWARRRRLELREVVVLVPYAELLGPARRVFGSRHGWMPRIETTLTLAAACRPPAAAKPGQLRFDPALDGLTAGELMRQHRWAHAWARRDPRAFDAAVAQVVATATALARAAFARHPAERDAYWQFARERLNPVPGPGATERLLARVALEWAALADPPASDALFELQPAGWVLIEAGAPDALARSVVTASVAPCLRIDMNAAEGIDAQATSLAVAVCDGLEDEAQAAAAQVHQHLSHGQSPVALIATDRELVRRVRALLARNAVPIADETGWRLSTTRAGALVMSLLRAARSDAATDDVLDALKAAAPSRCGDELVERTEAVLRREGWTRRHRVRTSMLDPDCAALWQRAATILDSLGSHRRRSLVDWLATLRSTIETLALSATPGTPGADAALAQVTHVLHLDQEPASLPPTAIGFDAFVQWVDSALEQAVFLPPSPGPQAAVVITPMARAVLRPFAAVILPGCDDKRLGITFEPQPLLGDALAGELGLPTVAQQREGQRNAFNLLLHQPRVLLLRRRTDGDEPLGASPLVDALAMQWRRASGRNLPQWADPRVDVSFTPRPTPRPAPKPRRVPARLSASSVEALRACPYRFFSRVVLGLREAEELKDDPEQRDYGSWLHAVLHRFHATRKDPAEPAADARELRRIALVEREARGLDDAGFLPYVATFDRFVDLYVEWQHEREARGWRWSDGEVELTARTGELEGVELMGRIDRIDIATLPDTGATEAALIDYKTGNVKQLQAATRDRLEDTQLAFYTALARASGRIDSPVRAYYFAIDDPRRLHFVEHLDVAASAQALLDGVAHELEQVRCGAGLAALGEGATCEYCEARGLCRRDDWPVAVPVDDGDH